MSASASVSASGRSRRRRSGRFALRDRHCHVVDRDRECLATRLCAQLDVPDAGHAGVARPSSRRARRRLGSRPCCPRHSRPAARLPNARNGVALVQGWVRTSRQRRSRPCPPGDSNRETVRTRVPARIVEPKEWHVAAGRAFRLHVEPRGRRCLRVCRTQVADGDRRRIPTWPTRTPSRPMRYCRWTVEPWMTAVPSPRRGLAPGGERFRLEVVGEDARLRRRRGSGRRRGG